MFKCAQCAIAMDTEVELLQLSVDNGFQFSDVNAVNNARAQIRSSIFICAHCRNIENFDKDLDDEEDNYSDVE